MACLEMYNNSNSDHKGGSSLPLPPPPMSPRISFSNDFAESQSLKKQDRGAHLHLHRHKPTTDFEFNISNNNSIHHVTAADELFFKGRILPFKDTRTPLPSSTTTLRDELLAGDDDDDDDDDLEGNMFSLKPPQSKGMRWKAFLGLKKSHIGSTNSHSPTNFFSFPAQDQPSLHRSPQGALREEGTCEDMEM